MQEISKKLKEKAVHSQLYEMAANIRDIERLVEKGAPGFEIQNKIESLIGKLSKDSYYRQQLTYLTRQYKLKELLS